MRGLSFGARGSPSANEKALFDSNHKPKCGKNGLIDELMKKLALLFASGMRQHHHSIARLRLRYFGGIVAGKFMQNLGPCRVQKLDRFRLQAAAAMAGHVDEGMDVALERQRSDFGGWKHELGDLINRGLQGRRKILNTTRDET